jgi:hypothetical protein
LHYWQQPPNAIPQRIADLQVVHLLPQRRREARQDGLGLLGGEASCSSPGEQLGGTAEAEAAALKA